MAKKAAAKRAASSKGRKSKAAKVLQRAPAQGWATSDADEIELRRWRGQTEIGEVVAARADQGFYGDFRVRSASGGDYAVEIRSLAGFENSCGC
ncbi:MAG TPA: hypothetical protein VK446_02870, partial [Methylocystis sp.]|nr:hypothetical protein [Methylocystis sp.]